MGGVLYTPVVFEPVGEPPADKSELGIETDAEWVGYTRAILDALGCLDTNAAPPPTDEKPASASERVPAYKLDRAKIGKPWLITPEECLATRSFVPVTTTSHARRPTAPP